MPYETFIQVLLAGVVVVVAVWLITTFVRMRRLQRETEDWYRLRSPLPEGSPSFSLREVREAVERRRPIQTPEDEQALRLARLLVSEIQLYFDEEVVRGRQNRDLIARLGRYIERGLQEYREACDQPADFYLREVVKGLAKGDVGALGLADDRAGPGEARGQ